MDVKYLRSPEYGDNYIANNDFMNIVSISKEDVCVMAEDDSITEGAYKIMNINKGTFENMKELAKDGKRKELTSILKNVHEKNKEKLKKQEILQLRINSFRRDLESNEKLDKLEKDLVDNYNNSEPILE